jgi:hypothetical protein
MAVEGDPSCPRPSTARIYAFSDSSVRDIAPRARLCPPALTSAYACVNELLSGMLWQYFFFILMNRSRSGVCIWGFTVLWFQSLCKFIWLLTTLATIPCSTVARRHHQRIYVSNKLFPGILPCSSHRKSRICDFNTLRNHGTYLRQTMAANRLTPLTLLTCMCNSRRCSPLARKFLIALPMG